MITGISAMLLGLSSSAWAGAGFGGGIGAGDGLAMPGIPREAAVAPALLDLTPTGVVMELSRAQIAEAAASAAELRGTRGGARVESVRIEGVPIDAHLTVDLELVRFRAVSPDARFEIVSDRGSEPLAFDPEGVVLLRGRVAGYPGSRVYLGLGSRVSNGWIDLGPRASAAGLPSKFWVRDHPGLGDGGLIPGASTLEVFPAVRGAAGGQGDPGVPLCGTPTDAPPAPPSERHVAMLPPGGLGTDGGTILGLRQVEIAVDTDLKYYELFNDPIAAGEYIVELYGAMSSLFIEEVRVRLDVTYFRLWTTADPWTSPNPLTQFRNHWNNNQQSVHRDCAQLLLGRRNLAAGGVAYLRGLCDNSSYSWSGYVLGHFADPARNDDFSRDLAVAAHEVGHNLGARHNHDHGIDTCQNAITPATRGGLMSYCGQTVSGAGGNIDMRFETMVRAEIRAIVQNRPCVAADCNQNGVPDNVDIALGTSLDTNMDGIPDECQDCNVNGILDPIEILLGLTPDVNLNGIPDVCEPDCNGNGVPDEHDIFLGTSLDAYYNGIPDECEADCNDNQISDYTEIRLAMWMDVDRDMIPDACQDCDGDGIIDRYALRSAHHLWVASLSDHALREFHSASGVLTRISAGGPATGVNEGSDLLITSDGRILVSSTLDSRILEFTADGTLLGDLAGPGDGLSSPTFMALHPSGDLLVSNRGTNAVLRFAMPSGMPLGAFVAPGSGDLVAPHGLAIGPSGNLYVASNDNRVLQYDGQTGAFIGQFVAAGAGGLSAPRGLCFLPEGDLLVASANTFNIIRYNGATGASLGRWQTVGDGQVLLLTEPWDVLIGPSGDVYVSASGLGPESGGTAPLHVTTARVFQFDVRNGGFVRAYVVGHDTGLYRPAGMDFFPDFGTDCNLNAIPDNCDIASGRSRDLNQNGVPDECECPPDLTTTAVPGSAGYGVPNGVLNNDDFFYYLAQFALGNLAVCDLTTTALPGTPGFGVPNGVLNNDDFFFYLVLYSAGC